MAHSNISKAVLYCRVSSKEQAEEGYSLDAQEKLLKHYAEEHSFTIVEIYKIPESASKGQIRKQFTAMLQFCIKQKISNIVTEKIDRLTRTGKDAAIINDWVVEDPSRNVHFVKEAFILNIYTKAHENLVWDMKVAIARFYTNNLSEEVKKGQFEKLAQGWLPGRARLGYKTSGNDGHKIHIVNPDIAIYIKQIFELYSTRLYSIPHLAQLMYEKGFRSIHGLKVSVSNIHLILNNPFYYGKIVWNGKIYHGKHEPIIDKELFDACQRIMKGYQADKYKAHNPLFRGLVICGECGHKVSWYEKKGHWYGRCAQFARCDQSRMPIREEALLEQVYPFFLDLRLSEAHVQSLKMYLQKDHIAEIEARKTLENGIKRKIEQVKSKIDVLYDDRLENRITPDYYDTKHRNLEQELEQLNQTFQRLEQAELDYFDFGINLMELAYKLRDSLPSSTKEEIQELFTLSFQQLTIKNKILAIEYTPWFAKLKKHIPALKASCELFKSIGDKQENRPLAVLNSTWQAYINDLRTLGELCISRVNRLGELTTAILQTKS